MKELFKEGLMEPRMEQHPLGHLMTSNSQKSLGLMRQGEEMFSKRWVMGESLTISICSHRGMQPLPEP